MKFVALLSFTLMLAGSSNAQAPEPPCLQACKDFCYADKDCPSFKKPANCIKRCDDNCVDKVNRQGCGGGTPAPTPEPTKAPLPAVPVCIGPCVDTCKADKQCSDAKCERRCTDNCLALYDRRGCPGPTASPTMRPVSGVPACMQPCITDCNNKQMCDFRGKKEMKCKKRCSSNCMKKYNKRGCPITKAPVAGAPTAAPYTNPPVLGTFGCDVLVKSGGQMSQDYKIMFDSSPVDGTIQIYYNMYTITDSLDVIYEGKTIFTTGGLVSGKDFVYVTLKGTDDFAIARLNAPLPNTGWRFIIGCVQ